MTSQIRGRLALFSVWCLLEKSVVLMNFSVQGNCQAPMPTLEELGEATGPELWPQKPGQCLLSGLACGGLFVTDLGPGAGPIWIDNLYLREGVLLCTAVFLYLIYPAIAIYPCLMVCRGYKYSSGANVPQACFIELAQILSNTHAIVTNHNATPTASQLQPMALFCYSNSCDSVDVLPSSNFRGCLPYSTFQVAKQVVKTQARFNMSQGSGLQVSCSRASKVL